MTAMTLEQPTRMAERKSFAIRLSATGTTSPSDSER